MKLLICNNKYLYTFTTFSKTLNLIIIQITNINLNIVGFKFLYKVFLVIFTIIYIRVSLRVLFNIFMLIFMTLYYSFFLFLNF